MENLIIEEGEEFYKKIKELIEVKNEDWEIYYINPNNNEKWVKKYPESSLNGGGSAVLMLLKKYPWEK